MCTSAHQFNRDFVEFVKKIKPKKILDLGSGIGKYGKLLDSAGLEECHITAVEINEEFDTRLKLHYDRVVFADVTEYPYYPDNIEQVYDLVIMGDILEHLKKSDGVDLVEFYVYRAGYMYIQFPLFMVQFSGGVHIKENHLSVWAERDFDRFVHDYQEISGIGRVIIEGRKVKI